VAIVEGVLVVSLIAVLGRLALGPTPWDRLMAANSITTRVLLLMAIVAVLRRQSLYLDVAVTYSAISFLGVVIVARGMERTGGLR
jgi:multicomponent Na+:H+ antiporter subunit F